MEAIPNSGSSRSPGPFRGGGGRSNSSAPQSKAASGAARQNFGTSDNGRPNRPTTWSVNVGAHPARTWKFWRWRVTDKKPTVRQSKAEQWIQWIANGYNGYAGYHG